MPAVRKSLSQASGPTARSLALTISPKMLSAAPSPQATRALGRRGAPKFASAQSAAMRELGRCPVSTKCALPRTCPRSMGPAPAWELSWTRWAGPTTLAAQKATTGTLDRQSSFACPGAHLACSPSSRQSTILCGACPRDLSCGSSPCGRYSGVRVDPLPCRHGCCGPGGVTAPSPAASDPAHPVLDQSRARGRRGLHARRASSATDFPHLFLGWSAYHGDSDGIENFGWCCGGNLQGDGAMSNLIIFSIIFVDCVGY